MHREQIRAAFAARFHRPAQVVTRAPGRINLIGEHTDYNDGFVLPIATQQSTWVAAARNENPGADAHVLRVCSSNLREEYVWPIERWRDEKLPHWTSYVAGVAELLRRRGLPLRACGLLIDSDVPVGSGLSSSAALTVAVATALSALYGLTLPLPEVAALCRQAEHEFAGVPCGVMDQYAVLACRADAALLLDCRSLAYEHVPLHLGEHAIVVVDSGVRHQLAASEYARRQSECSAALAFFQRLRPAVRALRDVDLATVRAHAAEMEPVAAARARHVASENERTQRAADAFRRADLAEAGRLMVASHQSLRDDYQVSCHELDRLVELLCDVPGVLGARMTGGGFGGSVVALVSRDAIDVIAERLRAAYDTTSHSAQPVVVRPGPGAEVVYP